MTLFSTQLARELPHSRLLSRLDGRGVASQPRRGSRLTCLRRPQGLIAVRCFAEGGQPILNNSSDGFGKKTIGKVIDRKKKLRDNVYYIFIGQKVYPLGFV